MTVVRFTSFNDWTLKKMVHGNVCSTFNVNFATALGKISLKHETKSKTNIYKTNKCVKCGKSY